MGILTNLISWYFFVGLVLGFAASRAWQLVKVCRLDKRRPLPDGKRRSKWRAVSVDPRWMAGAIAVAFLGWSVLQTNANENENERIAAGAVAFAQATRQCQTELTEAIVERAKVAAEYNAESERQRVALSNWLRVLLSPPPDLARLPGNDPARQQWALGVTAAYYDEIQRSQIEQAESAKRRPPLPDPRCD